MRFGGNPIEGSNPSLSASSSRTKCHHSVVRDGLLQPDAARAGALLHIGTHDMKLQERLLDYVRENGIPPSRYEFAMLYGINMPRQRALAQRGERVRCLVAYGEHWFP